MIYLLHPPDEGLVSGGYIYTRLIGKRLSRSGRGGCFSVIPGELEAFIKTKTENDGKVKIIFDSLYLGVSPFSRNVQSLKSDNRAFYMLIHSIPSDDPYLSDSDRGEYLRTEKEWMAIVDGVIVTGRQLKERILSSYSNIGIVHTVHPGIEVTDRVAAIETERKWLRPLLISSGIVSRLKNQLQIVEWLNEIKDCPFTMLLFGNIGLYPQYRDALKREIRRCNPPGRIILMGEVAQSVLFTFMKAADLFISASLSESYGMSVAEAVKTGTPVLSYKVGIAPELINDGINGFTYALNDNERFKSRLQSFVTDPSLLQPLKLSSYNKSRSTDFPDWDEIFLRFLKALEG